MIKKLGEKGYHKLEKKSHQFKQLKEARKEFQEWYVNNAQD